VKITLKIERYDPQTDREPVPAHAARWQEYTLEVQPTDRVLDALMRVKSEQDGSLAFRRSCAHGVCGSDAMRINGREGLACKTLIRDVATEDGTTITLQPLEHLGRLRDLMVDQEPFFARWRSVKPYLIAAADAAGERVEGAAAAAGEAAPAERLQSPEERAAFDDPTKCILCASCFSACPVLDEKNPRFVGPAAVAQAARFLFDSRDHGLADRLPVVDHPDGAWACENHFECTRVCPRGIKVTKSINQTKRRIEKARKEGQA
jgi:succinate dehydrogenase / fumarate reductase iron-sulfur subunit